MSEVEGLQHRGFFQAMRYAQPPHPPNILTIRIVLTLKHAGTERERATARPIAQGYKNIEKRFIIYETETLKHSFLCIILSFAIIMVYKLWSQDVYQVYIQSEKPLQRPIYIKPSKQLNLGPEILCKFLKPLHGVCDLGYFWHETFRRNLINDLSLQSLLTDELLYTKASEESTGVL